MSYVDDPCDRCGSKRIVTKVVEESLDTFSGPQKILVSQIICSNKDCQAKQDASNAISKKENEDRKQKKIDQDALRKNNIQLTRAKKK